MYCECVCLCIYIYTHTHTHTYTIYSWWGVSSKLLSWPHLDEFYLIMTESILRYLVFFKEELWWKRIRIQKKRRCIFLYFVCRVMSLFTSIYGFGPPCSKGISLSNCLSSISCQIWSKPPNIVVFRLKKKKEKICTCCVITTQMYVSDPALSPCESQAVILNVHRNVLYE